MSAFLTLVSQSAVCNSLHTVEQRCCRWLLMAHARAESASFLVTQESLSRLLGVRLASISGVASRLRRAGLIQYSRGNVTIVNHEGLVQNACECYRISRAALDRLRH